MSRIQQTLSAALKWSARHTMILLAVCLALAVGLRAWGLDYGLPFIYHPDESVAVVKAQLMLKTGDFNPHFFHWPSLLFYLNAGVYSLHYLVGRLLGVFQTIGDIPAPIMLAMGTGRMPMPSIWLISRAISLIFGVGVVVLAFLSGKALTGNTAVGLLAALFTAISPTNIANSRLITPDMPATFFIFLTFYASVKVWQTGQRRYYILTGIAVGLAMSAKYNAALILVAFALAHFWRYGLKGVKKSDFYLTLLLGAAVFLLTSPYVILDHATFLTDLQFDKQHYSTGHPGMEGDTLNWYLTYLWQIEGIVFILAFVEMIRGFVMRSKATVLTAVFPAVYFLFISSFVVRNARTLLPALPFFALLAAMLIVWAFAAIRAQKPSGKRTWLAVGAVLIVLAAIVPPLRQTVQNTVKLTAVDSRETARIWIADELPHGSTVAIEAYSPYLEPDDFTTTYINYLKDYPPDWYRENGFDYLIFSEGSYGRFFREPEKYKNDVAAYEALWGQLRLERLFADGDYEVRIYAVP
jgi:4-amino-4-deoxy-L-arabinose transferase-like glycosyltransferase